MKMTLILVISENSQRVLQLLWVSEQGRGVKIGYIDP